MGGKGKGEEGRRGRREESVKHKHPTFVYVCPDIGELIDLQQFNNSHEFGKHKFSPPPPSLQAAVWGLGTSLVVQDDKDGEKQLNVGLKGRTC